MSESTTTYNISVPASTEYLSEVRNFVANHAAECGFSEQEIADIRLAVDEAYTNIIKHAYNNDRQKAVDIELGCDQSELWVALLDTGNAFDPNNYKKPDIREKIKRKKRRRLGVYLIRQLMDDVEYQTDESTNTIRMTKRK